MVPCLWALVCRNKRESVPDPRKHIGASIGLLASKRELQREVGTITVEYTRLPDSEAAYLSFLSFLSPAPSSTIVIDRVFGASRDSLVS
jgi:hypothetical protein